MSLFAFSENDAENDDDYGFLTNFISLIRCNQFVSNSVLFWSVNCFLCESVNLLL